MGTACLLKKVIEPVSLASVSCLASAVFVGHPLEFHSLKYSGHSRQLSLSETQSPSLSASHHRTHIESVPGRSGDQTWIHAMLQVGCSSVLLSSCLPALSFCLPVHRARMEESLMRDHPPQEGRAGLLLRLPLREGAQVLHGVPGQRFFQMLDEAELGFWIYSICLTTFTSAPALVLTSWCLPRTGGQAQCSLWRAWRNAWRTSSSQPVHPTPAWYSTATPALLQNWPGPRPERTRFASTPTGTH